MQYKTQIIDGKQIAANLRADLKKQVEEASIEPGLAVILVGDDPASQVYVRNKLKACEKAGIRSFESRLPASATQEEVHIEIQAFNDNPRVHGILMQLPVPDHLDSNALIQAIKPEKDVDGLTFINQGKLMAGDKTGHVPCTPQGALMLIKSVFKHPLPDADASSLSLEGEGSVAKAKPGEGDLSGLHAVVIGRSLLFGKPMAQLLLAENCTVTQAHSKTRDLPEICRQADILVAAVGRTHMVKSKWIKPGAIVIDVGINRLESGKLAGDVDFEAALGTARAITPVPGGVGPMTIAFLLQNTLRAATL